jgi:hypothetical protein
VTSAGRFPAVHAQEAKTSFLLHHSPVQVIDAIDELGELDNTLLQLTERYGGIDASSTSMGALRSQFSQVIDLSP